MAVRNIAAGAVLGLIVLAGCDNGPSAVETRDRAAEATPVALTAAAAEPAAPTLTVNRRETVDAKLQRLYERNGADFGARSAQDYLDKVRAFTRQPQPGVETIQRPNGDTLFYQASSNTFAVVARDGTPRTMFKPDDGHAYWAEQKVRAPDFGRRRAGGGAESQADGG